MRLGSSRLPAQCRVQLKINLRQTVAGRGYFVYRNAAPNRGIGRRGITTQILFFRCPYFLLGKKKTLVSVRLFFF